MSEKDFEKKVKFLGLLNLEALTPENASSQILDKNVDISSDQYSDLFEKNNSIITGYENFCIKKGKIKLFPFKDFDFIGKNVVCQKCCQKFVSKMSYKVHVGTDFCVRTLNGPNLVYLDYKNRNNRRVRKKSKPTTLEDLIGHDLKKHLLNPEMFNTLRTRNNCYSDVVHQRNKVEGKQRNNHSKSDESTVKKPRGRPKKNIEAEATCVEPKKRGRPKKIIPVTVDRLSETDNSLNNSPESCETELIEPRMDSSSDDEPKKQGRPKKIIPVTVDSLSETDNSLNNSPESCETELIEPRMDSSSDDEAYNNNLYESGKQSFKNLFSSEIKILHDKFWNVFNWSFGYQHSEQTQGMKEKIKKANADSLDTHKDTDIFTVIECLEDDLKLLMKLSKSNNEFSYQKELKSMLSKLIEKSNEYKQSESKTNTINESTTDRGKENIHCTIMKNERVTKRNINKIDSDASENVGISNKETSIEDTTPNYTNSVNHLNSISDPKLTCRTYSRHFPSVAECKIHLDSMNEPFLCNICGMKFKMHQNYKTHVNEHKKIEIKPEDTKTHLKPNLICRVCGKRFMYLRSYYVHIKSHGK